MVGSSVSRSVLVLASSLFISTGVLADQFVVQNALDSGPGSLRDAVGSANNNEGPDEIVFVEGLQEITLDTPLQVSDALSIIGPDSRQILSGGGDSRLIISTEPSQFLHLQNLDIRHGSAEGPHDISCGISSGNGGAICSLGDLSITNSVVQLNQAERAGGAIYVYRASLVIEDSLLQENHTVMADSPGGALRVDGADSISFFEANQTSFRGNSTLGENSDGGALSFTNTEASIVNSSFDSNLVAGDSSEGGALVTSSRVLLRNVMAAANQSAESSCGAFWFTATASIEDSTIHSNSSANTGGALCAVRNFPGSTIEVVNSTIANNQSTAGASAIFVRNYVDIVISNSTVTDNTATESGSISGAISLNSFFPFAPSSGDFRVESSIIAGNSETFDIFDTTFGPHKFRHFLSYNVLGERGEEDPSEFEGEENILSSDPQVETLADNGCAHRLGFPNDTACVLTAMPADGSITISNGSNPLNLEFDQRGPGFARTYLAGTTIGAISPVGVSAEPGIPVPSLQNGAVLLLVLLILTLASTGRILRVGGPQ